MAELNVATSIVDKLKSMGQPSDFNFRKQVYDTAGLASAFGDYRGTAEQNTTLLRRIQGSAQPAPAPASAQPTGTLSPAQNAASVIDQTTPSTISSTIDIERSELDKIQPEIDEELKSLGATELRGAETLARDVASTKFGADSKVAGLEAKGTQLKERLAESSAGFGGSFSGKVKKGQAEIAQEVAQKQEAVRNKMGDDLYNKFSDFEKNFGTDFLRTLSIPEAEEFAKLPLPIRGAVVSQSQKIIESAINKARSNAEKTLSSLGYVQLPDGTILQKPSELRAEQAAERAEQRLTLAEQAGARAEQSLALALARFNETGGGTATEKADRLFDEVSRSALQEFERTKGTQDNYYNPDVFMSYRNKLQQSAPSKIDDFDKAYALRLNPVDALRLGINQAKYQSESDFNVLVNAIKSGATVQIKK